MPKLLDALSDPHLVGTVRVHCYDCAATVTVSQGYPAGDLHRAGWGVVDGASYCGGCARWRGIELGRVGATRRRPRAVRWLLVPAALLVAAIVALSAASGPRRSGDSGPPSQRWSATGVVFASTIATMPPGTQLASVITTSSRGYVSVPSDTGLVTARLVHRADGWHATLPPRTEACTTTSGGTQTHVVTASFVFHFVAATMDATATISSPAGACAAALQTIVWHA